MVEEFQLVTCEMKLDENREGRLGITKRNGEFVVLEGMTKPGLLEIIFALDPSKRGLNVLSLELRVNRKKKSAIAILHTVSFH